jgi:GNAT superfamily N-acetyltransferase
VSAAPPLVRRIAPGDATPLRDVRLRALRTEPIAFGSTYAREAANPVADWEAWAREHSSGPDRATFLALRDGAAVGIASGTRREEPGRFGLFAMWVDVGERRHGVGRALVESVVAWIIASGGTRLTLWVTQDGARAFYESLGFADDGRREPLVHTPEVTEIGMTREI